MKPEIYDVETKLSKDDAKTLLKVFFCLAIFGAGMFIGGKTDAPDFYNTEASLQRVDYWINNWENLPRSNLFAKRGGSTTIDEALGMYSIYSSPARSLAEPVIRDICLAGLNKGYLNSSKQEPYQYNVQLARLNYDENATY